MLVTLAISHLLMPLSHSLLDKNYNYSRTNLLWINQVYYWRLFHNQLFTINIKQKLLIKVIKNAKQEGLGWEMSNSIKLGVERKSLKWRCGVALIKSRECFAYMNICNWLKLLPDKIVIACY